jgi:hypothetical protein
MKKYLALFALISLVLSSCIDHKTGDTDTAILAFYNVENLFDTIDDPSINDEEFLPDGRQKWDTKKYNHKIKNLSDVLISIDSTSPPAIIGLAEVENKEVIIDLIQNSKLSDFDYSIIHKNSPDFRGIDVAIIYRPDLYEPEFNEWINISFPFDSIYTTRDILYTKGKIFKDEMIHIFVNHWTSRYGGQEVTTAKREFLGALLKVKSDSILAVNPNARIFIMGDLNDNPTDASLTEALQALPLTNVILSENLYNVSLSKFQNGEGSLYYRSWDLFDQIVVSGSLLKADATLKLKFQDIQIHKPDWVLFEDNKGIKRPNRTASGGRYYGGFSDHLPVYIVLTEDE